MIALRAQHAYNGIPNARVTQVPHVGRFVAINVGVLDQYFCANACLILPKISTSVKDTLNDGLTNKWPVQAKIEIAWFGDCDFCNAWNMHIPQHRCQPFGNE